MKHTIKKIVSMILVCVMTFSLAYMPTKAATYTDVAITSITLDGDYAYPKLNGYWGIWQFYLNTDVVLPGTASQGNYQVRLTDGTNEITVKAQKANDKWLYLEIPTDFLPELATKTITVEAGQYEESTGTYGINLTADYSIRVEGGVWSPADNTTTIAAENKVFASIGTSWDANTVGDANGIYFHTTADNGAAFADNWNIRMNPAYVDTNKTVYYGSGIWYADSSDGTEETRSSSYKPVEIVKFTANDYYVAFADSQITVTTNDLVKVQGYFTDPTTGKVYGFYPMTFRFDGTGWVEETPEVVENYSGQLMMNEADWALNANSASCIYLKGTDGYLKWKTVEDWNSAEVNLTPAGGSIKLDNASLSDIEFKKTFGSNGYYFLNLKQEAATGAILTIEGTFKYEKVAVTFDKVQFKWNGSQWEEILPQGPLTVEGAQVTTGTALYLQGTDSYLSDRTYEEWEDGAARLKNNPDAESGIFLNDVKQNATLIKYNAANNYYYIEGITGTQAGEVVTVKGKFYDNYGSGRAVVEIEESKYKFDGSKWVDFDENAGVTFTSLAVDRDYLAPNKLSGDGWAIWQFYLKTNYNVTTNLEYFINYKIDDGDTVYTTVVQDLSDIDNVFYSKIDQDKIDEANGTTITYLAGEYQSTTDSSQKMVITEDFTFHVNQYGWSTVKEKITPDLANKVTLTHAPTIGNGGNGNGFYLLADCEDGMSLSEDWSKHLTPVALSPEDTYYTSVGEGGLWKNDVKTDVKITKFPYVDKPCYYVHASATEGATYEVKGLFKDSNGRKVAYQPIKVTYKDGAWKQVYTSLNDTGVQHDVNSDLEVNSVDLIRLIRHTDNNMISVNDAQKDINYSGKFDKYDEDSLRKVLVGMIYYKNGEVYGTPIYNDNKVIEKMAYAGPEVGKWNAAGTEFTPYSKADIDAIFQKYKAAGLTLLGTENVAVYQDNTWESEANEPVRVYMEAAERNGLGVLVFDSSIQWLLSSNDVSLYDESYKQTDAWKIVIDNHIKTLQQSDAFRGFMIWDELSIEYLDTYNTIVSYIRGKYPDLILLTSQFPVTAYDVTGLGGKALTTDAAKINNKKAAYEDYIWKYAQANKHYVYDLYPLVYSADKFFGSVIQSSIEYGVQEDWYLNLQYVANQVKAHNYSFTTGITIQSCKLSGTNTQWSQYERYMPEQQVDIGFQVYTAMSYGMKELHYFTWRDHWSADEVEGGMLDNENVYNAVSAVNAEIDKFANVYQSFAWKDTLDLAKGATNSSTGNSRLTSAKAENARAFVGCMKDTDGFDGYMVSNAAGPRENVTSNVTLTFVDAKQAIVYTNGVPETKTLTNGVCTVNVPSGEGVFVIPLR